MKKKTWLYIVLIALAVGLSAWLLVRYNSARPEPAVPSVTPRPTPEVIVKETEVEKIVEVEKEITSSVIEDGLRDIGVLVTQEYYFTDVISFSSVKKLFRVEVPFTETSYLASYDGVVTAGIDFGKVSVVKDDAAGKIVVTPRPLSSTRRGPAWAIRCPWRISTTPSSLWRAMCGRRPWTRACS